MSDNGIEITTGVGRIVWGDPTTPSQKIDNNKQKVFNADGSPKMQTSFGVAYPKAEFQAIIWPAMAAEAAKGYPQGVPGKFSWKYVDGDGVDSQGRQYNTREGYAGCYVLAISTELQPPGIFKLENGTYRQMQPTEIKCGDWVRLGIALKVNVPTDRTHTPGLFVNPMAIEHVGYGTEIKTGFVADPNALFGGQAAALPAGASATPVAAPGGAAMPGMGMAPPPQQPGQPGMPGMPAMQPPAATMAPPPPAPVGPARPIDPTHVHDNGNGTEQWFINGAWDGGAHPKAAMMPPPATGFVDAAAAGMPAMPGMPGPR